MVTPKQIVPPRKRPMLYPLRLAPIFRHYLWGGRRLETLLGKQPSDPQPCAESWELVDHGEDVSVVTNGPLAGKDLRHIALKFAQALFGRHEDLEQFPLLFKFLDAHRTLSVQVHPGDAQAAQLHPPDLGKTEAWVVLAADPGSKIYAGLKRGFDRHALKREVARGTCELCLHQLEPTPGDCVFIPAGTVHALGAGLVVAEIQQASDTTFRLFDWNRVDASGKPRQLHIEEALETIDYQRGPVAPQAPQPTERPGVEQLVACDKFVLDRWRLSDGATLLGKGQFHFLAVLSGTLHLEGEHQPKPLARGDTVLVPASCETTSLHGDDATFLDIYLP